MLCVPVTTESVCTFPQAWSCRAGIMFHHEARDRMDGCSASRGCRVAGRACCGLPDRGPERSRSGASSGGDGAPVQSYLPLALALCTVVVLLALVGEARNHGSGRSRGLRAWHFGLMAPLVFTCQELFERLAHDGTLQLGTVLQPTFFVGLALQIPFAIAAFVVAWVLLRAARAVGRLFGSVAKVRRGSTVVRVPSPRIDTPRLPALALGFGTRGPPASSL